jgi:hypothetical protein
VPPLISVCNELEKVETSLESVASEEICAVFAVCFVVSAPSREDFFAAVSAETIEVVSMSAPAPSELRIDEPSELLLVDVVVEAVEAVDAALLVADVVVVMAVPSASQNGCAAKSFTAVYRGFSF